MSRSQPRLRLTADLLVDTDARRRRAGMRAGAAETRQFLFRAGDLYLDLNLRQRAGSPERVLAGQLLDGGTACRQLADLPVTVECSNGTRIQTRSNRLGEFLLFGLPEGGGTLGVSLDAWTSLEVSLPAAAADRKGVVR